MRAGERLARANPHEVAVYVADMAASLEALARGAGLTGLSALLRAASDEAARAMHPAPGADPARSTDMDSCQEPLRRP